MVEMIVGFLKSFSVIDQFIVFKIFRLQVLEIYRLRII